MTLWQAAILVFAVSLFLAALALPLATVLGGAAIMIAAAALALFLRRIMDRETARSLSGGGPPGSDSAEVEVDWYHPYRSFTVVGTVATKAAAEVERFTVHDASRRPGLRLLKRLGLGRRLGVDDEEFERLIYFESKPQAGARLFATAESRLAARAIFDLGFFAIDFRHGLVVALRRGKVSDDIAARVRPHLVLLARNAGR